MALAFTVSTRAEGGGGGSTLFGRRQLDTTDWAGERMPTTRARCRLLAAAIADESERVKTSRSCTALGISKPV
jgi:hypothetical protein